MKNVSLLIIGAIIGALATYYFCPNCAGHEDVVEDIIKPAGVITSKEAMVLDEAFNSRHQLISDSIVMRPDNRSAWWSIEDMDGVRLYLGAYPDSPKEGVGYTTMFFVPTGTQALSEGSSMPLDFKRQGGDIPGGDGLNKGNMGDPPSANYPN